MICGPQRPLLHSGASIFSGMPSSFLKMEGGRCGIRPVTVHTSGRTDTTSQQVTFKPVPAYVA